MLQTLKNDRQRHFTFVDEIVQKILNIKQHENIQNTRKKGPRFVLSAVSREKKPD